MAEKDTIVRLERYLNLGEYWLFMKDKKIYSSDDAVYNQLIEYILSWENLNENKIIDYILINDPTIRLIRVMEIDDLIEIDVFKVEDLKVSASEVKNVKEYLKDC